MTTVRGIRVRAGAALGITALSAVLAAQAVVPAQAAPTAPPAECPAALTSAQATTGLVGQGLTVVRGTTPEPFRVDVLGVLPDGIGAGHDLVLIKVSDLPGGHVVDQGSGIWAGMSGSPVYVGDKLLGAVSYGFTSSPSPIGGLTPASDMAALLQLKTAKPAGVDRSAPVRLSAAERRAVADRAGVAVPSSSLDRLPSPLSVSGVGSVRLKRLQKDVATAGLPLRVHAGGRAAAPTAAPTRRPVAGGNFATVESYGDVTAASVGTTTYVCGAKALAYGHPDSFSGPARTGANDADALAIVQDDVFGSFKMANVTVPFGTVDQDRMVGIRADLGAVPSTIPITTTVRNADSDRSRTGTTQVVDRDLLAGLTPYALWANLDATFDEVGDGRMTDVWTIKGRRGSGKSFTVHRRNTWADRSDTTFWPAVTLADVVDLLTQNEEEKVSITSIIYEAKVWTAFRQLRLTKVEVSTDGGKTWTKKPVKVKAGKKLSVRTSVTPFQGGATTKTVSTIKVPKSAKGSDAALTVVGGADVADGSDDTACLLDDSCDEAAGGSLSAVVKGIQAAPRNDDLVVALEVDPGDDEGGSDDGTSVVASRKVRQAEVVTGARGVEVRVR